MPARGEETTEPSREAHGSPAAVADDAALAAGCAAGNLSAFEHLYRTHGRKMRSMALNLLGNVNDAEDAVQETFMKVYRGMKNFQGGSQFSTWAFRILINTCYDALRSRRRTPQTIEPPPGEADDAPPLEVAAPLRDHPLRMALEKSVQRLKPQQRDIFLLFEVEGFRHQEIAAMLDITVASSKNTLFQAKQELRRMILEARGAQAGKP